MKFLSVNLNFMKNTAMKFDKTKKLIAALSVILLFLALYSCSPGKKIKNHDCGCWSHNTAIKKNTDDQKQRS